MLRRRLDKETSAPCLAWTRGYYMRVLLSRFVVARDEMCAAVLEVFGSVAS